MPLPVYFPTQENTLDQTTRLPSVKLATARKSVFGGTSFKNYLTPENSGGTVSAANHVGADSSRVYNTKDTILAKMALLYNAHGGIVTPDFGQAITSPNEPFNFAGIALSDSPNVDPSWIEKFPNAGDVAPPQRSGCQLAYHANIQRAVLFGGVDNFNLKSDTWEWDGTRWVERILSGPAARYDYGMVGVVFSGTPSVFLFGGQGTSSIYEDTWGYFGNSWFLYSPATDPGPLRGIGMAFDSKRSKVVLFGGLNGDPFGDTWEFDPTIVNWAQVFPASAPSARYNHAMVFDSSRNKTVLFSGSNGDPDTWEYDGVNWTQVFPPGTLPSARTGAKMVYNTVSKKIIMFGGLDANNVDLNDTWEYDGAAWTQIVNAGPSPREFFGMTYDSNRDKVVLFGGANTSVIGGSNQTWELGSPIRPVVVQATGDGFVYWDATTGRPTPIVGDFLGPAAPIGTVTPIYDGYSPVFGIAADNPVQLSTILSTDIDSITTTIAVGTTTGFPSSGTIFIDSEQITYTATTTSTFTGCTRGANSTTAASHVASTTVFSTVPLTLTVNGSSVGVIRMRVRAFYGFIPPLLPSITDFTPSAGQVGDEITLNGTVFVGTTQITINGTPAENATFDVISNNQITFIVPAGAQKGTITVTNAQGNSTSVNLFVTLPEILSVIPNAGAVGTSVTIAGNTFTYTTSVTFNGVSAVFVVNNDSSITATIPVGGTSGDIVVSITYVPSDVRTATYHNFGVVPPPQITNVAPLSGAVGAFVAVTGSGFEAAGTPVFVDFVDVATMTQILAASFTAFNDTTISAIVPNPGVPQPSKAYYVRVTTPGGIVLSSQQYTIIPVPKFLDSPGPTFSPTTGVAGTVVSILGDYGFTGLSSVQFDGYESPNITFLTDSHITAVVPSVSAPSDLIGPIRVTSAGGTRKTDEAPATLPTTFTILQSPAITSLSRTSGKSGDTVTITGSNLLGVSNVIFTTDAYATYSVINSTQINATVPSSSSGIVFAPSQGPITITKGASSPYSFVVSSSQNFLYYPPPTGLAISSPAAVDGINGGAGTSVTLTGSNLNQGGTPTVTVGGVGATVNSAAPNNVIITVPGGAGNGISLSTAGGSIGPITFIYLQPCSISSFVTSEYYDTHSARTNYGGDTVDVYGSNFRASPDGQLYIQDPAQGYSIIYVSYTYINSGHIQFVTSSLSQFAGDTCNIVISTFYPGGTYTASVGGLSLFIAIG